MAKRLSATEKWDKAWFRKLPPKYKCFWQYILDKCDLIGLWEIDFEAASFNIGEEISGPQVFEIFGNRILRVDDKILILGFCPFQYGETLNLRSPIHKKVKDLLDKYTLYDTVYNTLSNRAEREVEVKEEVKVKEKRKEKVEVKEIVYPFDSELFLSQWELWKAYKKKEFSFKYKSEVSEQAALKKLSKLAEGNEQTAIDIIHQSIAEGWKGFFNIQKNGKKEFAGGASQEFRNKTAERLGFIQP